MYFSPIFKYNATMYLDGTKVKIKEAIYDGIRGFRISNLYFCDERFKSFYFKFGKHLPYWKEDSLSIELAIEEINGLGLEYEIERMKDQ